MRLKVTPLDQDEAELVREKIMQCHPDILERQGLIYRHIVSELRETLFDYLAAERVLQARRNKQNARSQDLERVQQAVERYRAG